MPSTQECDGAYAACTVLVCFYSPRQNRDHSGIGNTGSLRLRLNEHNEFRGENSSPVHLNAPRH